MTPCEGAPGREVRVLAIGGSLRERSHSRAALLVACQAVRAAGGAVDLLDLRTCALPWFDAREDEASYPPVVHDVRARIAAADAYLLATPQYHSGPSGALKNLLDFIHYPDCETTGKLFGLIAVAGGRHGAMNTLSTLRLNCRALSGWVLPQQVTATPREFDAAGELRDQETIHRLRHLGHSLVYHARLLVASAGRPAAAAVGHHNQREPLLE